MSLVFVEIKSLNVCVLFFFFNSKLQNPANWGQLLRHINLDIIRELRVNGVTSSWKSKLYPLAAANLTLRNVCMEFYNNYNKHKNYVKVKILWHSWSALTYMKPCVYSLIKRIYLSSRKEWVMIIMTTDTLSSGGLITFLTKSLYKQTVWEKSLM